MIFVVVEEVIPESQRNRNTDLATAGAMLGFAVMMVLDVAFSNLWKRIIGPKLLEIQAKLMGNDPL